MDIQAAEIRAAEPVELIAFDLDGTILTAAKEITPRTREALRRARAAGIHLIPATGRQFFDIPAFIKEAASPFLVANNGSQIYAMPEGDLIFEKVFDQEAALALLREAREEEALIFAAHEAVGIFDNRGRGYEAGLTDRIRSRGGWEHPMADLEALIREGKRIIKLVMLFEDTAKRNETWDRFRPRGDLYVTSFAPDNVEIMPVGINKGEALKMTAAKLGVPPERVMALGDSDNDREMLRFAGLGVAMANAPEDIRACARRVTLSCDEDGAAAAIEEVLASRIYA
ncbi:MAG: Cof-type HAD-IIB family hydrolase [Treponema sp.]|nr:Cof-type HAD-IIB family hydrolase [Treponema sp.]